MVSKASWGPTRHGAQHLSRCAVCWKTTGCSNIRVQARHQARHEMDQRRRHSFGLGLLPDLAVTSCMAARCLPENSSIWLALISPRRYWSYARLKACGSSRRLPSIVAHTEWFLTVKHSWQSAQHRLRLLVAQCGRLAQVRRSVAGTPGTASAYAKDTKTQKTMPGWRTRMRRNLCRELRNQNTSHDTKAMVKKKAAVNRRQKRRSVLPGPRQWCWHI